MCVQTMKDNVTNLSSCEGLKKENALPFKSFVAVNSVLALSPYLLSLVLILINKISLG